MSKRLVIKTSLSRLSELFETTFTTVSLNNVSDVSELNLKKKNTIFNLAELRHKC